MANHILLNNIEHKDLRVINRFSAECGDNVGSTLTFPTEFGDVQKEYPIFFQINPTTGSYQSVALFGLKQNENLFLADDGSWNANYIPAVMARGPFLIGFQKDPNNPDQKEPVIHIDMDSKKLSKTEGASLFLEYGGVSPYLEKITVILKGIYDGMALSDSMFQVFSSLNLIEPVSIEIELNNGEQHRLHGNYTISKERLRALNRDELFLLNQSGFLEAAYLVMASLNNMQRLTNIKNKLVTTK